MLLRFVLNEYSLVQKAQLDLKLSRFCRTNKLSVDVFKGTALQD